MAFEQLAVIAPVVSAFLAFMIVLGWGAWWSNRSPR